MMAVFQYDFMRRAFAAGILLAVVIACIGVVVVLKRLSMIGDALSHTSLAGVAAGLIMGINPIAGAIAACVISSFCIEAIRRRFSKYEEMAIAIVLSAGIGLAGVLSGFVKNSVNFNSFLFGSIVSINDADLIIISCVSVAVLVLFSAFYRALFYISFDERAARLAGVPVRLVNTLFTLMTAVTVSVASQTVGVLLVSSLMVLPVACSMALGADYKKTVIFSVLFSVFFTVAGLYLSFYLGLKPSGTVVLTGVACLIAVLAAGRLKKR